MKKITFIFVIAALLFALQSNAQICDPPCEPEVSCVDIDNPGQICPDTLPSAHVDEFYDETVTVIPPATFNLSGSDYDIKKISVTSVEGLPDGVDWCKSEEFFTITDPITRYCCQLKGTPEQVGEYQLTLTIVPYYDMFGSVIALPAQTDDTSLLVIVLPVVPEAAFQANVTTTTTGAEVMFTDESLNNPTSWAWAFEGGTPASSSIQNPTVTYDTEGIYDVTLVVANDGGSDELTETDYIIIDNGTGINESMSEKVKLYPNPATHQITVEAEGLESVSIVDMLGQTVYAARVNGNKEVIDISKLGKANYLVKIVTADGETTKSISIK
jgi:hypothetical protein